MKNSSKISSLMFKIIRYKTKIFPLFQNEIARQIDDLGISKVFRTFKFNLDSIVQVQCAHPNPTQSSHLDHSVWPNLSTKIYLEFNLRGHKRVVLLWEINKFKLRNLPLEMNLRMIPPFQSGNALILYFFKTAIILCWPV